MNNRIKQECFSNHSKECIILIILCLIGFITFFWLYPQSVTSERLHITINRHEAHKIARKYIESLGFQLFGFKENIYYEVSSDQFAYYQEYKLSPAVQDSLEHFSTASFWHVTFRHPERNERFLVLIDGNGKIFQFRHVLPNNIGQGRLTQEAALNLVKNFLVQQQIDLSQYQMVNAQTQTVDARTDHVFRWESISNFPGETKLAIAITVQGEQIDAWARHLKFSSDFNELYRETTRLVNFVRIGRFIVPWSLIIIALILFIRRYHESEVSLKNSLLFSSALMGLLAFIEWNAVSANALLQQTFQVDEYHFQYFITYLNIFLEIFFLGLGSFLIWSNGESMTREIWPPKLRSVDALFSGRFFSIEQGKGIFRGFAMAGIQLGLSSLITYCVLRFGSAWYLPGDEEKVLFSSVFPPLVPLTYGLFSVLMGVAWPLLFTWSFLRKILKKTLLSGFLSLILFEICFSECAIYNIWLRIAVIILIALVSYYFYLRYDVFTVAVGVFVIVVVEYAIRYLIQPNALFSWVGGISLMLPVLLLIYGAVLVLRGNKLDDAEITPRYVRFISERERLKLELDIARKAQLKMLPQTVPDNPSLDIAACSEPAREVGGDYYDFIKLDPNRLGIVIGDVSGKGMPAALYMTLTKGFFLQAVSESHKSPKEIMTKINRNFYNTAESRIFITLFYGIIDLAERKMTYLRAGHTPIVFRKSVHDQVRLLQPAGIAIGLEQGPLFDKTLQVETIPIDSGNFFVFYTDGLTEGMNLAKEEYGEDRLLSVVQNAPARSAQELLEHIRREHKKFVGRQEALDDFTCVVVKIL